jgi:hypothetical protein
MVFIFSGKWFSLLPWRAFHSKSPKTGKEVCKSQQSWEWVPTRTVLSVCPAFNWLFPGDKEAGQGLLRDMRPQSQGTVNAFEEGPRELAGIGSQQSSGGDPWLLWGQEGGV